MSESERRMLKIKTGSVNRLKKELGLYVEEKERERQKVARMKEEAADTYDIKHAVITSRSIDIYTIDAFQFLSCPCSMSV